MTPEATGDGTLELGSWCSKGYNSVRHEGVESNAAIEATQATENPYYKENLKSWSVKCMLDDKSLPEDIRWVVDAIEKSMLVGLMDGSYNLQWVPETCAKGWVVCCRELKIFAFFSSQGILLVLTQTPLF